MAELIQCYAGKKTIHRNFINVLWAFFFLKSEIYFLSPEIRMEIHPTFNKKVTSKFWHVNLLPSVTDKVLVGEHRHF